MRILVVDDEQSFGSLLGRTLKRLGHRPLITAHPRDALELLRSEAVDAVITDIDMPEMDGIALARTIRAERADMPIAFCTGSAREPSTISAASSMGRVLPKVWTVADVKDVVAGLGRSARLARGSDPEIESVPRDAGPKPEGGSRRAPTHRGQPRALAPRPAVRKLTMSCRTWARVEQLCHDQAAGRTCVAVRGQRGFEPGERVTVALRLPDELVLQMNAVVAGVSRHPSTGEQVYSVRLVGLTDELCERLRAMAREAS